MERIYDKALVALCCVVLQLTAGHTDSLGVAYLLLAIGASAFPELRTGLSWRGRLLPLALTFDAHTDKLCCILS